TLRGIPLGEAPRTFNEANGALQKIAAHVVGRAYGTRVDWQGIIRAPVNQRFEKEDVKYEVSDNRADVTAPQVLGGIDRLDKVVPGTRAAYEILCEFAHPNVGGLLATTATVTTREDRLHNKWVSKRLGLSEPAAFVDAARVALVSVFRQLARL